MTPASFALRVLRIVRDNPGAATNDVFEHLLGNLGEEHLMRGSPGAIRSRVYQRVGRALQELESLGLINPVGDNGWETTAYWHSLQGSLEPSLTELSRDRADDELTVRPVFGNVRDGKPVDAFVLMPFTQKFRPVYDDHIVPVFQKRALSVKRADDIFSVNPVVDDIWRHLATCGVVVADCTGRNPNVLYELGIAHTLGKRTILLTQTSGDVPFDLQHIRYIEYEYTPRGMKVLESRLHATLDSFSFGSPVSSAVENPEEGFS